MKKFHKPIMTMITLLLSLCMLAGCGGTPANNSSTVANNSVQDKGSQTDDVSFPLQETVTLSFLTRAPSFAPQNPNDKPLVQRIEEETNVHIDWTCFVEDQFKEKRRLALAKKELPDAVFDADLSQYDLLRYAKDGVIISLEDLIDQHMPNFKKVLDENPQYRALITAPDGHIYSFPWIEELGSGKEAIQAIGGKPWINKTWLDELGLDMPTTTAELEQVLIAFRDGKPQGRNDILPLSFMLKTDNPNENAAALLSSFGYGDNPDHYIVTNENKVIYALADPGIKPGFEWLNGLYAQGLIDPEVFTHDWGTYAAKGNNGRYGVCVGWDRADIATADDYVALPPLKGPDGNINVTRQNAMGLSVGACVITSTNKNVALTAKYIDKMYEPLQSVQNNWGTYGDSGNNIFELTAEGTLKHLPIPAGVSPWELRRNTNLSGPLAVLDSYYGVYTTRPDDAQFIMNTVKDIYAPYMQMDNNFPPVFQDMDTQTRITQIETDLKPYAEAKKSEWIMNGGVNEQWDGYIKELEAKGLAELLALKQKGLDEYFANM